VLSKQWCRHHNTVWPHSALGYRASTPEVLACPSLAHPPRLEVELVVSRDEHSGWTNHWGQAGGVPSRSAPTERSQKKAR
jgi:hypothetical protein